MEPPLERWSGEVAAGIGDSARLDRYVAEGLKLFSRSQIRARGLSARVNGRTVKISRILRAGDFLELSWNPPPPTELVPEDLPLDILYEDRRVLVIDKAQGMVVHPGAGNPSGTLANALLWLRRERRAGRGDTGHSSGEGGLRPGIVHRLDKDTSGLIIAAWDDAAQEYLARQFRERKARKTYVALVQGAPPAGRGRIDTFLARDVRNRKCFAVSPGGKRALTFYRLRRAWEGYSLLLLRPKTGRTHQLRVHLRHLGCPVLGDPLYGRADGRFPKARLMLHALRLSIRLPPDTGEEGELREFTAPLPERFREIFRALGRPLLA